MNQSKSKFGQACIIGLFIFAFILIIANVIINPLQTALLRNGHVFYMRTWFIVTIIRNISAAFLALLLYSKLIQKTKLAVGASLLTSLCFAVVMFIIGRIIVLLRLPAAVANIINYMHDFVLGTVAGLIFLNVTKKREFIPAQSVPGTYTAPISNAQPEQAYAQPNPNTQSQPADMDALSVAILNAIRPSLKAPMSAVLCPNEQLLITNDNGEYDIRGIVHSQNSYGAMIATDFAVKARYINDSWIVSSVSIGKQAAKNYAKSFVSNYIAISIFVALMGLLSYLILTLIIG